LRAIFFENLIKKIKEDPTIYFLTGDTGYNLVEPIFHVAPDRALNVGVAEQNMIGIAAGLVNAGFTPVCYAITNFLVHRCFEQIRNDICLHNYKVILVGTSTGYDNGSLGATHHKLDDIGALKVFPNIDIYSPSSDQSIKKILDQSLNKNNASFIRITKNGITENEKNDKINRFVAKSNTSSLIITHGKMVSNALEAYKIKNSFSILAMDQIKPIDHNLLNDLFSTYSRIYVIEDNFNSGLFNSVCQWSIENKMIVEKLVSIAPEFRYESVVGSSSYLENIHGLNPTQILKKINKDN